MQNDFEGAVAERRMRLLAHPIYGRLTDLGAVRVFMAYHVFAVWDFMSLLKSLQRSLTCVGVPWLPVASARTARFINEIVLAEETDEVAPGEYASHFELYLRAMREVGADERPIRALLELARTEPGAMARLERSGHLDLADRGGGAFGFVATTFRLAACEAHVAAAAFLFGREDVIPDMFLRILDRLPRAETEAYPAFRLYLERHVHLDGESHGPLARKMLAELCGSDERKWCEAETAAIEAIDARLSLWDEVDAALKERPRPVFEAARNERAL